MKPYKFDDACFSESINDDDDDDDDDNDDNDVKQ